MIVTEARFALWDLDSRNIAGEFATEEAAYAAARRAFERHGRAYAESFATTRDEIEGDVAVVAEGVELIARALDRSRSSEDEPRAADRAVPPVVKKTHLWPT